TFFPIERPKLSRTWLFLIPLPGIAMALINLFSDLLVRDVLFKPWGREVFFGPLFPLFALYCAIYVGYAFAVLIYKLHFLSDFQKTQVLYVFFSFLVIGIPSFVANIVLPAFFGNYRFIEMALYFALPEAAIVAYALLKHRLMSVEIIIQKGVVYTSVTALILSLYALAVIISETFFRQIFGYSSLFVTSAAILFIAIIYQPLLRSIQNVTDQLFFRGRYNYQKTLREMSQKIASVIRIEELTKLIVASFVDTMKVSEISFLLLDKDQEHFRSFPLHVPRYKKIEIDIDNAIIASLAAGKDILLRDEVPEDATREAMDRLGIHVWVPIISKDVMIGIIALGSKLSGDLFTSEDIGLLSTLASQTAVALDNARLYDEVVNARDYIEKIIRSMVDGVLTVDNKGVVTTYNLAAEKITGRKESDVLGKTCEEIWGKRGVITSVVENALNRKSYFNYESGLASPERGLVPVSFSSTILLDPHGRKMGALLTLRDLSEVKELEGKVRRADKLAALATMAAGMAHEIKNPLSSMKVLSQLLPKKIDDPEFRSKLEEIMPREIDRIDRIVESLLGFARATSLTFEKVDLNAVIEENVKYFERQAAEAEIKIKREYASLPPVEIDHAQIGQVFSNLILNAIQAMHGGGELSVTTAPGKKDGDVLCTVKVTIADSGHGIPEETLKKLFDPFFTTKYGGTGLGLTITHSIVDGHKGYIDVDSKVGKGTSFTVTLPVDQRMV
ncbi:MAG: ATP-binding protein, partial [Candidatus Margulisiibacteriota bacterium]